MAVPTWVCGAFINVTGSIAINLGTNLFKLAHVRHQGSTSSAPTAVRSQKWRIGFAVFLLGNLCNFISFDLAAQSLLAGLGSVQFITNVLFARAFLKEPITSRIMLATLIIVSGNILIISFASHSNQQYSSEELFAIYTRRTFIIYSAVLIVLSSLLHLAYTRWRTTDSLAAPVMYVLVSGIIGTQAVMFAKSISVLFHTTIFRSNQFDDPIIYIMFIMWFITMSFWFLRMNSALAMFDGSYIIPMLQVSWIMFSVFGGGVAFNEFAGFTMIKSFGFSSGILLIIAGVYLLAPPSSTQSDSISVLHLCIETIPPNGQPMSRSHSLLRMFAHDVMFGSYEVSSRPSSPSTKRIDIPNEQITNDI